MRPTTLDRWVIDLADGKVRESSPPKAAEDEGVLMGLVYNAATDRSDPVILDAATLETAAAIHLPRRVPFGFTRQLDPGRPLALGRVLYRSAAAEASLTVSGNVNV